MNALRVLHVSLNASHVGGGVATYIWRATKALHEQGVINHVACVTDADLEHDAAERLPHAELIHGPAFPGRTLGAAPRLWREISEQMDKVDVVHLHGLRASIIWSAASLARKKKVPFVISPHGQLHPWLLSQRRTRKLIVDTLFTRRDVRSCSGLHAVSEPEADDIRRYMPQASVTTVPIGIDPSPYLQQRSAGVIESKWPEVAGKSILLYCSIMTPRKGLPMLASAWSSLASRFPGWHLVIAGMDLEGYLDTVRQDFAASVEGGTASILGRVTEDEKAELLQRAELLVLPTLSEAFGMIILESLSSATPVVTTTGAPWSHIPDRGCGWWVEPTVGQIETALETAMAMDDAGRAAMGERGRRMVLEEYTWQTSAQKLVAMYRQVIDQSSC